MLMFRPFTGSRNNANFAIVGPVHRRQSYMPMLVLPEVAQRERTN